MTTVRLSWLSCAALVWAGVVRSSLAVPLPQQAGEAAAQPASATAGGREDSLPQLQKTAWVAINGRFQNPFAAFGPSVKDANRGSTDAEPAAAAAPAAYPAGTQAPPPSSTSWAPTHFEIFGDVQWRNLSNSSGFTTSYCLPSGCVTNTGSFNSNLGQTGFGVGPDFGFIWTPDKKILGARSKIWVEYEQLNRSKTRAVSGSFTFLGETYQVNTTLQSQLNTHLFSD